MAPINPRIAISNRNTPHAITPPSAGVDTKNASFLPYAAIPIRIRPRN